MTVLPEACACSIAPQGIDKPRPNRITCPGARRGILQLPGVEEDVGMVGIHWQGQFIELVPWTGKVQVSVVSISQSSLTVMCNEMRSVIVISCRVSAHHCQAQSQKGVVDLMMYHTSQIADEHDLSTPELGRQLHVCFQQVCLYG